MPSRRTGSRSKRLAAVLLALAVCCVASLVVATPALADDQTIADPTLEELQKKVEDTNATYEQAAARQAEAQSKATENQARIDELNAQIPGQRDKASSAMRTLYKYSQQGTDLVDLLLNSEDFNDLITTMQYLDVIRKRSTDELESLVQMQDELEQAQSQLEQAQADADTEAAVAQEALQQATDARDQAQREAQAKLAAQAAEALAAADAAAAQAASTADASGSLTTSTNTPGSSSPTTVDMGSDKDAFVSTWTGRIDSYLAGSPLAGQGATFAEAAWDYGVDPRWSPAISNTESSKGLYCFRSHNAWGWGQVSWGSWEEAIRAHVKGLASGYGYTITPAAAQKYCLSSWQSWYYNTLAEMESI
jgi:peptidoglycan hydrolase CwlO-like protein